MQRLHDAALLRLHWANRDAPRIAHRLGISLGLQSEGDEFFVDLFQIRVSFTFRGRQMNLQSAVNVLRHPVRSKIGGCYGIADRSQVALSSIPFPAELALSNISAEPRRDRIPRVGRIGRMPRRAP